ncbi:uracil-DNA glycosylase family protein [Catenovulum sp. SM1970]|uniref:uracil-DNA glycosylase family protein n=1 Tax=Marinifaba aquimaris TaxID=2741323 RepID=UPI00157432B6|nr:uracil-DNA glycosylase family protein [Marinifaba aquimaris]NTS78887.1 uracil-DNA glycosylase family protein [Marinifaba aquimaris]
MALLSSILACKTCEPELSASALGANPILSLNTNCQVLIIGQAPGKQAHINNKPFTDASGKRLRQWLGLSESSFYSEAISIIPMAFCYPGKAQSGDKAPDKRCALKWHHKVMKEINPQMTLLLGQYSQQAYLPNHQSVTENCRNWQKYAPLQWPLPHPSPRNQAWLKHNPWFELELLPNLRTQIAQLLNL